MRKCRFSFWYRQKSNLNIFRFLKSVTSEAFKNRAALLLLHLVVCMNGICRGNKTEWELQLALYRSVLSSRTAPGSENCSVRRNSRQRKGKWRGKEIQAPGDELPGQGGSVARAGHPAQPEPPAGRQEKVKLQKLSWITAPSECNLSYFLYTNRNL